MYTCIHVHKLYSFDCFSSFLMFLLVLPVLLIYLFYWLGPFTGYTIYYLFKRPVLLVFTVLLVYPILLVLHVLLDWAAFPILPLYLFYITSTTNFLVPFWPRMKKKSCFGNIFRPFFPRHTLHISVFEKSTRNAKMFAKKAFF